MAFWNNQFMLVKHIFIQFRNIRLKTINPKWITNMQEMFFPLCTSLLMPVWSSFAYIIRINAMCVLSCTITVATVTSTKCLRCMYSYVWYWIVNAEREHYQIPSSIPQIDKYSSHISIRINSHAIFFQCCTMCCTVSASQVNAFTDIDSNLK